MTERRGIQRNHLRRSSIPIYALAASIVLVIFMSAYLIYNNRVHERELTAFSLQRQESVNDTFMAMCDRLALRDEILINILGIAADRARTQGDRSYAQSLENNMEALKFVQDDCVQEIPRIINPPPLP
jgi:hypothetical protein